jgi:CO/xanthine dehydrogenase Mo-binding subunit
MNLAFRMAMAADDGKPRLPGSLEVNRRLSQWLTIRADGKVEVRSGKVEIGQGILTALAQIVACELQVRFERIVMVGASTAASPDEAVTSGSLSVQESGSALRHAAAEARCLLIAEAARRSGFDAARIACDDGEFRVDGRAIGLNYWAFADAGLLEREATGKVAPLPSAALAVVGASVPRIDLPDKVFGLPRFVHDLELPGMLHAAILRPPSPAARLVGLDDSRARAIEGCERVLRDGSFVGVLAASGAAARRALEALRGAARWEEAATLPDAAALGAWLKQQPVETKLVDARSAAQPGAQPTAASRTVRAAFTRPYLAHASLGPACALACWSGAGAAARVEVWTHSQGIYNLRADLALATGLPAERIVVHHVEGAGCYGHNGADDVAWDAVLMARAEPGRPVRVLWSRADELAWSPFGPPMLVQLEADLDAEGRVLAWRHDVWSNGHGTRPGRAKTPALLAAWHLEQPHERLVAVNAALAAGGGSERNAVPGYEFASWQVHNHRLLTMPIRTSALRSLGAFANVFAVESFVDDLAREAGRDPLDWRLDYLRDPRARAVLEKVAQMSGWRGLRRSDGIGYGMAYARYKNTGAYCAVVAEIEAGTQIRARRLWIAVDVGRVINPDGIANQTEGGAIQATSWALKEAVTFDRTRITSDAWETYPILRFSEVPQVTVEIISDPDAPSLGAGESAHGPVAGALGNAVRDALGVRVRDLPLTPEQIAAAA